MERNVLGVDDGTKKVLDPKRTDTLTYFRIHQLAVTTVSVLRGYVHITKVCEVSKTLTLTKLKVHVGENLAVRTLEVYMNVLWGSCFVVGTVADHVLNINADVLCKAWVFLGVAAQEASLEQVGLNVVFLAARFRERSRVTFDRLHPFSGNVFTLEDTLDVSNHTLGGESVVVGEELSLGITLVASVEERILFAKVDGKGLLVSVVRTSVF